MSETLQITSIEKKPKDPRRVEAGKRLAAISKAAKEKKAKERYERNSVNNDTSTTDWTLPVVGVTVVGLAGLCYVYKRKSVKGGDDPSPPSQHEDKPMERPKRSLDSFD